MLVSEAMLDNNFIEVYGKVYELELLSRKRRGFMSNIVTMAPKSGSLSVFFNEEKIELIKKTICKGATDDELSFFLMQCQRTGLDPFARQIYSVERKSKNKNGGYDVTRTTQVSIDGFRSIADRTGKYAGQKPTEWCGKDGVWTEVWLSKEYPIAARVGVLRKDFVEPLYGIAKWDAYALDNFGQIQKMWAKMPDHMLAKVAEALALRKSFPQDLSGLYTADELGEVIDIDHSKEAQQKVLKPVPHPKRIEAPVNILIEKDNYKVDIKELNILMNKYIEIHKLDKKDPIEYQKLVSLRNTVIEINPFPLDLEEVVKKNFEYTYSSPKVDFE